MQVSNNVTLMNMAQVLDKNKDGKLQLGQEIQMSADQLKVIDTNQDKELSTSELDTAIQQDFVQIQYTTNKPAMINLNFSKFRGTSNDKSQGIIYGGVLLGGGAGAGIGALVAMATGAPASAGAPIGAMIGAVTGAIGSGVYSYKTQHPETVYKPIDPTQEPDPAKLKKSTMIGMGVGAGIGAAAGAFGLSRLGLLPMKTSIFVGTAAGATIGMFVGNAIGVSKPKH